MKNPFTKKPPADRRDALAAQLATAEAQAAAARDDCITRALAGEDASAAEETSRKAEARATTLTRALAQIDREIAEAEAARIQAKLEADRKRAAGFCTKLVDRADAEFAVHEARLLNEHAELVNDYRKAIGHDVINFSAEGPWRGNLNDLRVVANQFRERASRILAGRADDEMRRVLASIK